MGEKFCGFVFIKQLLDPTLVCGGRTLWRAFLLLLHMDGSCVCERGIQVT